MAQRRKIVLVSDLHGWLPEDLPAGDLLIIAGDFCPITKHGKDYQRGWIQDTLQPWLHSQNYMDIVAIGGNHDFIAEAERQTVSGLPWHYLQDESLWIQDLHIWGSPWAPPCGRWAFMRPENQLEELWRSAPDNIDLLVTHTPAGGAGDRVVSGKLVGSDSLRSRLLQIKPALHVCGHIHEGRGHYNIGSSTVSVNASLLDETYQPWSWCYQVDLERGEDGWRVSRISEEPLNSSDYDFH